MIKKQSKLDRNVFSWAEDFFYGSGVLLLFIGIFIGIIAILLMVPQIVFTVLGVGFLLMLLL